MAGRISNTGTSVRDSLVFHFEPGRKECYDRSGTSCKELSTYSNSGNLTGFINQTIWDNDGSGCIVFDGTNDYIDFASAASPVRGSSQFTISYWVKKNSAVSDSMVGAWYHTGRNGFFIQWGSDGIIYFGNSAGGTNNNTASLSFTSGAWYHIVGVFDGSQSTNATKGKIYVNGQLITQSASGLNTTTVDTYPAKFYIGALEGYSSYTGGKISLVQLYGRALSASEVLQNYNIQKLRYLYDTDAQAFLNNALIFNKTQELAIKTLVTELKRFNLWSKMVAVYPMVGGTEFTHKFNLKNPQDTDAAYRLQFLGGGWIHSSTGAKPNGTGSYADTKLIPTSSALSSGNTHMSYYSRNVGVSGNPSNICMGTITWYNPGDNRWLLQDNNGVMYTDHYQFSVNRLQSNVGSYHGLWMTNRLNTAYNLYRNAVNLAGGVAAGVGFSALTAKIYIAAHSFIGSNSVGGNSSGEIAFATIGLGLTTDEVSYFYTIVQNYQTALGRQV